MRDDATDRDRVRDETRRELSSDDGSFVLRERTPHDKKNWYRVGSRVSPVTRATKLKRLPATGKLNE
jgi:hypothetical protein